MDKICNTCTYSNENHLVYCIKCGEQLPGWIELLDKKIKPYVIKLNQYDGIKTTDSCEGHITKHKLKGGFDNEKIYLERFIGCTVRKNISELWEKCYRDTVQKQFKKYGWRSMWVYKDIPEYEELVSSEFSGYTIKTYIEFEENYLVSSNNLEHKTKLFFDIFFEELDKNFEKRF